MKILFLDLETSPHHGFSFGPKFETSIAKYTRYSELLTAAWKWHGEAAIHSVARPNFKPGSEKAALKALWKALDEADVVIGHNVRKFDKRVAQAQFERFGLGRPSPYRIVDTLTEVRKHFYLPSNKLEDVCAYFGLGKKMGTGGFDLWDACMNSDPKAFVKMLKYNKHDVRLLPPLYKLLLPYITTHPNLATDKPDACPRCGGTTLKSCGWEHTQSTKYRRFRCMSCKGPVIKGARFNKPC